MFHLSCNLFFVLCFYFLFFVEEKTVSNLSRLVLITWLFVVLILNSSYIASLTSILTVEQLSSPIKGIETLINSKDPIGYQQGSHARSYLVEELHIQESKLVPLNSPKDQGQSQKFLFGGPICVANLLVYTNFYTHTQTHVSIHTYKIKCFIELN